jgi:hypothetical protein
LAGLVKLRAMDMHRTNTAHVRRRFTAALAVIALTAAGSGCGALGPTIARSPAPYSSQIAASEASTRNAAAQDIRCLSNELEPGTGPSAQSCAHAEAVLKQAAAPALAYMQCMGMGPVLRELPRANNLAQVAQVAENGSRIEKRMTLAKALTCIGHPPTPPGG